MEGLVVIVILLAVLSLWVWAAVRAHHYGRDRGMRFFFLHLLMAFGADFILWLIIVYPGLNCHGFLCNLSQVIIWLGISTFVMALWPIILLNIVPSRFNKAKKPTKEDILDDL